MALVLAAVLGAGSASAASAAPADRQRDQAAGAGLAFLRKAQNPDGSFGPTQKHLQTGLAILAFLSAGLTSDADANSPLPAACKWLLEYGGEDGFLGDAEYPLESHAVCTLALSELRGTVRDEKLAGAIARRAAAGVAYALKVQDKAVGADYYGGWKASMKAKTNDRRVTAWYLLVLRSALLRRQEVPDSARERAVAFMAGSQKVPSPAHAYDKADVGGFSYDATGLPVVSITGAGLAALSLYDRPASRRDLARKWLAANRPIWYGPNFYYTHVFTARGLAREAARTAAAARQNARYARQIWEMLRDHQDGDGGFQLPPGNAENTQAMGRTYATAMAVLILNAQRNLLPVDAAR